LLKAQITSGDEIVARPVGIGQAAAHLKSRQRDSAAASHAALRGAVRLVDVAANENVELWRDAQVAAASQCRRSGLCPSTVGEESRRQEEPDDGERSC
jgi:hypothetical protein